jgi:hypothetical protein
MAQRPQATRRHMLRRDGHCSGIIYADRKFAVGEPHRLQGGHRYHAHSDYLDDINAARPYNNVQQNRSSIRNNRHRVACNREGVMH